MTRWAEVKWRNKFLELHFFATQIIIIVTNVGFGILVIANSI
jgi:hypothetical protein